MTTPYPGATPSDSAKRQALRKVLESDAMTLVPGAGNAHHARLAEAEGFSVLFSTGAGIANTFLGMPDLGLLTATESLWVAQHIAQAVSVPVIADADNGYGNLINAARTAADFERAGAAAIILEDQTLPKRCGHFRGKSIVPREEMIERLYAARSGFSDPDMVLVARTDAIQTDGLSEAIDRACAYAEAGADLIFVEAPRTVEHMRLIPREIPAPCLINIVEGGDTPNLTRNELAAMGYRIALYANLALRASAAAVTSVMRDLITHGDSSESLSRIQTFDQRQNSVGLPRWQEFENEIVLRSSAALQ